VRVGGKFKGGQGFSASATAPNPGPTVNDDGAGSGGGGGWFGGGGGGTQTSVRSYPSGGGGSSYSVVGTSIATNLGTDATPFDSGHKPAGVAQGGTGGSTNAFIATDGGDGAVYLKLTASADQATNIFKATGADQTWTAPSFGTLRIKGYAAGGGGGNGGTIDGTHPAGWGGPGGYIDLSLSIATGDVITIEVGKGGVPGTAASGAFGGWPDGGNSGRFASAGINGGSGGGSTRIYKNGVLEGIAGAGGGGIGITSGGAGGGLTGDTGTGVNAGTGGTQTAGGDTPNHQTATPGISFHGGNGYVSSITAADDQCGGGGGGGYFGGGGGYAAGVRGIPGGGGGSSHFGPDAFNTLTQKGTTGTGTPFQSNVLVPFVGYGGIGQNAPTVAASGYDGLVAFYFTPVDGVVGGGPIPTITMSAMTGAAASTVFGALSTITMSAPAAGVKVGTPVGGFSTGITMTAATPTVNAASNWTFAPLGTVTMFMNLVGTPPTEAIVSLPISDYDIVLAMGTTTEIHASALVDKFLLPLVVRMSNPRAFILGFANGDLGTAINLTAVTGGAETGPEAPAVLDAVVAVAQVVEGSATGAGVGFPNELRTDSSFPPRRFAQITMNGDQMFAFPQSGAPLVSTSPIPQIAMQLPLTAFAEQGIEVFADINSTVNLISNLGATAGGSALATVRSANSSLFFPDLYVARVLMVPAFGPEVHGAGDFFALTQPVTVVMDNPSAIASHGAFALSSILPARIVMRAPQALGFAGNFALAIPDMENLVINMSEVTAFSPVTAQAFSDPILVDYVDGYVDAPLPPGISRIKWKRSQTPGAQPLTLAEREVALNEYDGVLYSRDGSGAIRATPYLGFGKGRTVPAGGATVRCWASISPGRARRPAKAVRA
jgi:hypothetical protein